MRRRRTSGASPACQSPCSWERKRAPPFSLPRDPLTHPVRFCASWWSQPKHAKKSVNGLFGPCGSDRNARIHGRADVQSKKELHYRTHEEIQDRHAARTIQSKSVWTASILSGSALFRTSHGQVQPPTHICAFRSLPEAAKIRRRRFLRMFWLTQQSPRETVRCRWKPASRASCGLCHWAKDPAGRTSA